MKKILLLLFLPFLSFSQGINNLWLLGYYGGGGGINFSFTSTSLNITQQSRKMSFDATNGVICDKNGNLLFSSNGVFIANAYNDTIDSGSGLNPSDYTTLNAQEGLTIPQANLIIPFPDDSTKYYLFHQTIDDDLVSFCSLHLYYSVIDMTLDSGRGAVIHKNVVLLNDSLVEGRLTGCKHANGRDWWLFVHQYHSERYYKYLITPSGIDSPSIQDIGTWRGIATGQCVFSPDGNKFAYYDISTHLDLFDFDRCTGSLSNPIHVNINDSAAGGGAAFSPNSKVLYVSSMNYVYQFDMNAGNISASQTIVAVWDSFYSPSPPLAANFYLSQLAPDGKIYINCGNSTLNIHVINQPDSLSSACNFCQHCIHLPAYNAFTIANHPNYFLGWESGSVCDSLPHVGIAELTESNKINVYPNPVSSGGEVTFTYPSTGEIKTLSVFNIDSKEVARYPLPQWSSVQKVKLPLLAHGIYVARMLQGVSLSNEATPNVKFIVE